MHGSMIPDDTLRTKFSSGANNLHLIRLIAACTVIYGHAYAVTREGGSDFITTYLGYGFTGGLAVDAFFVISGFLVTASVLKGDWIFYTASRALRIFPALWACVGLTAFVFGPLLATGNYSGSAAWKYFWGFATLTEYSLFLPGLFESLHDQAVNGVLWSVIIEAKMYFATLVAYWLGILRYRPFFNAVFVFLLVAFYLSPPTDIILGFSATDRKVMLLYVIGAFFWINRDLIRMNIIGVSLCVLLALLMQGTPKFELAYLLALPYIIMALAVGPKIPWFDKVDYSYGIYLWGWPIQQAIQLMDTDMSVRTNQLIAIPLAVVAGAISWHLIEQPALRQKKPLTLWLHRWIDPIVAIVARPFKRAPS